MHGDTQSPPSRRHVLLVSYHFPPDPAVGGLRAWRIAEALAARGHAVTVLTAAVAPDAEGERPVAPGLTVRSVTPHPSLRDAYIAVRRWGHLNGDGQAEAGGVGALGEASWRPPEEVPRWKRFISSLMWLPDDRHGFILPAVAAGMRAFADGADLLYTTGPPFTDHVVGLLLQALTGMPWACEYRDPWVSNYGKETFVRSRLSDAVESWLEQHARRRAAMLVAVSQGIHTELTSNLSHDRADRVLLIRNGIARMAPPPATGSGDGRFRVVHTGTFYYGRDPGPFLQAVRLLLDREPAVAEALTIELIGDCRWYRGISVEQAVRDLGLDGAVEFADWLPHDATWERLLRADLLLLLAQHQPTQVPNKLYEYLGTRRPILALVDAIGESAALLRDIGGHRVVTREDPEAIAAALHDAFRAWQAGEAPRLEHEALLAELATDRQMARLCRHLEVLR